MATTAQKRAATKKKCIRRKIDQGYTPEAARYHCDPKKRAAKGKRTKLRNCVQKCQRSYGR